MNARRRLGPELVVVLAVLLAACGAAPKGDEAASSRPVEPTASATSARPSVPGGLASSRPSARPGSASPTPDGTPVLTGHDWERVPTDRRVVALTFDAGANADAVPSILATLRQDGVPATFFLTGTWVRSYPDAARRIVADGFAIGNHTMTHPHMSTLADDAETSQVLDAERAIVQVTGHHAAPYFRFPFGDRTDLDIALLNRLGYVPWRWTVDTLGWKGTGATTAGQIVDRVVAHLQPGEIVLMHVGSNPDDGSRLDADALPAVIAAVRANGYGFGTLPG